MTPDESARIGITLLCACTGVPFLIGAILGGLLTRQIMLRGWWGLLPARARTWWQEVNQMAQAILDEEKKEKGDKIE